MGQEARKRGRDNDGDEDDPNKCRKTGGGNAPPKPMVARKEPRKKPTAYPPINKKLPDLLYLLAEGENLAGPSHVGLD